MSPKINYRVIAYCADQFACYRFRIDQPHRELKRYGVSTHVQLATPSDEGTTGFSMNALIKQIARYDLVIIQRLTSLNFIKWFKEACDIAGKPLIFESDDDYLHLEKHNPCFFSTSLDGLVRQYRDLTAAGKILEAEALKPELERERIKGLNELKYALSLPDLITTTTEELAQVFRAHNKNVVVLPNCVEQVYWERDYMVEAVHPPGTFMPNQFGELVDVSGQLVVPNQLGFQTIPAYYQNFSQEGEFLGEKRVLRVGYTGTTSHQQDFETIRTYWDRLVEKYKHKCWFIYIGDPYFADQTVSGRTRRHWIKDAPYDIYRHNIRNLDIGIAPLEPTPFNMGKSDIKLLEYGMWGIPGVAPNYITYSRSFTHGETALLYNNGKEFYDYMEELINNSALRLKLGNAARKYVYENRLEENWVEKRFLTYKALLDHHTPYTTFSPNKEKVSATTASC